MAARAPVSDPATPKPRSSPWNHWIIVTPETTICAVRAVNFSRLRSVGFS